jgi:hypothetical protein
MEWNVVEEILTGPGRQKPSGSCYLASEVDALLAEIKRVAYGSTVWRDVFALIDGAADSADDVNGTETI